MRAIDISEEITIISEELEYHLDLLKLMRKATGMDKEVDRCYSHALSSLIHCIGYQISNLEDLAIVVKREDEIE